MRGRLAGLLGAALLAACTPGGSTPTHAPPTLPPIASPAAKYAPQVARHQGGSVTVGDWQFPSRLAPVYGSSPVSSVVEQAIYNGMVGIDASLSYYGDLARQVPTLQSGGVTLTAGGGMDVTYELRPGLRWSDGQALTADDVVFTWRVIVSPASAGSGSTEGYDHITGIDRQSETGLVVHFVAVYPAYLLLFGAILPRHRLASIDPAKLPSDPFWARPDVVSGPFSVKEAVAGDHITLARNPHYADGRGDQPQLGHAAYLDRVVVKAFSDKPAELAAAKAGDIQVAVDLNERDLDALASFGELRVTLLPALAYEQLSLNQASPNPATGKPPPWEGDPALLQALDLGLDRPSLLAGPLRGRAPGATSPVSPLIAWAYDPSLPPPRFDAQAAARLLDADGWQAGADGIRAKGGRRLAFVLSTTGDQPLRAAEEEVVVAGWRRLGADVAVQNFTSAQLFGAFDAGGVLARGTYEAALWAWITPPDPDFAYALLDSARIPGAATHGLGQNYSRCHDAALDQALGDGRASLDQARRQAAYRAFQTAYTKARCELPLYQRLNVSVSAPTLHNFAPNPSPVGNTWNLDDWWIDA